MLSECEVQTLKLTRAAALERIARAIMDFEDWTKPAASDLSRQIAKALGFK